MRAAAGCILMLVLVIGLNRAYEGASSASNDATLVRVVDPISSRGNLASNYRVIRILTGRCTIGSAFGGTGTFRCKADSGILSQCWRVGGSGSSHTAVCQGSVWEKRVIEVKSSLELPRPSSSSLVMKLPWGIELVTGQRCSLGTGIPPTFETRIVNYRCSPTNQGLLGVPDKKGEVWTFEVAIWSTTSHTFSAGGTALVKAAWVIKS